MKFLASEAISSWLIVEAELATAAASSDGETIKVAVQLVEQLLTTG